MLFSILIALSAPGHAAPRPTQILRLDVACVGERSRAREAAIGRLLRRHNPSAQIRSIQMEIPCAETSINEQRENTARFAAELAERMVDQPRFEMLCLSLPEGPGEFPPMLYPLGEISPGQMDWRSGQTLAPLAGRGNERVKIVLTAGSALTGPKHAAAARARTLLDFVGAESGMVFGLSQPAKFKRRPSLDDLKWWKLVAVGASALDFGLGFTPHFTMWTGAFALGTTYSIKIMHQYVTSNFLTNAPVRTRAYRMIEGSVSSLIGTALAAATVMTAGELNVTLARNVTLLGVALTAAAWTLPSVIDHVKRIAAFGAQRINAGRLFVFDADTLDVRARFIGDVTHEADVFGCEEILQRSAPAIAPNHLLEHQPAEAT